MARASFKGLDSLKRKLIRLKEDTAGYVRPALEAGANDVVQMAKRLVPVKSGRLRDSIGWTFGSAPKGAITIASAKTGDLRITIFAGGPEAIHARWVEFGTAPHVNGGLYRGSQNPGMRAQPYFYPSWRANRKKIQAALRKSIRDAVRVVVNK